MHKNLVKFSHNLANIIHRKPAFLFAEILLTYHCTQRCLQCNIPDRASKENIFTAHNFKLIADKLSRYGTHGIVLSGGEALLHPRVGECIEYIAESGFLYRHILSNLFISKSKIEKIIPLLFKHKINLTCSFDGLGATADKIRGGSDIAETLKRNMELIDSENKKAGRPIKTSANMVVSQLNLHQIPEMLDYLEKLGWMTNVDIYRNSSVNHNHVDEMFITNRDALNDILKHVKKSPVIITPAWLLDGYSDYFDGNFKKLCPYLDSPSLGSKFYIHPNGEVHVCIGKPAGNLLHQSPAEIFESDTWTDKLNEFRDCAGCWNTCYTPAARLSNYLTLREVKNILKIIKR